jgi:hypothetical protein
VLVHVGPVESGSVVLWVAYARTVLAQTMSSPERRGTLDASLIEGFEALLDEWEGLAEGSGPFVWSVEVDAEQAEYLAHGFYTLVSRLAADAEQRGYPISPPEGDAFYHALVTGLLDALVEAGGSHAEYGEHLRSNWPGYKPD